MKRLTALAIALMLCALPALAELWYTDDILADGSPVYYFEELSLTLPPSWAGKVMAVAEEGGAAFYQRASHEKYLEEGIRSGGFLFRLGASVNGSFSELPAFKYLGFSEASALNYYLELPTDYPAYMGDAAIRAEYDAMAADMDAVAAGARFYQSAGSAKAAPTLERTRYHFEHSALPRFFYEDPGQFLEALRDLSVFRLWASLADENGVEYPYTEADFAKRWYASGDGATVLQITLPRPETTPQCYRVYFVHNAEAGLAGYYTAEYDDLLGERALLCGWDKTGNHTVYGDALTLDEGDADRLLAEAKLVAECAGVSTALTAADSPAAPAPAGDDLALIPCPEQGFTTRADPAYSWDYQADTGVTIYTEEAGRIPYVMVFQSEDLLPEPLAYIREQYTPHMQSQYGGDLMGYVEYERYEIGGKQLPAGLYTYRVQGTPVDMLRLYDSTGRKTVAYSAKYIRGRGDATLAALDAAIRNFRAD